MGVTRSSGPNCPDCTNRHIEVEPGWRKCLFLYHYHYQLHPRFGFMHAIQTWLPFAVQVSLNGREWLARNPGNAGQPYQRRDNCFTGWSRAPSGRSG